MSNPAGDKLTLVKLAALDVAASPGPYLVEVAFEYEGDTPEDDKIGCHLFAPRMVAGPEYDALDKPTADFLAASKGAAPALLAALRGLADSWCYIPNEEQYEQYALHNQILSECAQELRALIEQADLSKPQ